jgi:hypothetical protein
MNGLYAINLIERHLFVCVCVFWGKVEEDEEMGMRNQEGLILFENVSVHARARVCVCVIFQSTILQLD